MHKIPKTKNKTEALKKYLEANKNDKEGNSWIFGHNPNMIKFLNSFTTKDYENLKSEIENWKIANS